jgi:hypothetical protein
MYLAAPFVTAGRFIKVQMYFNQRAAESENGK